MRFDFSTLENLHGIPHRIIGEPMRGSTTVGEGFSRYSSKGELGFFDSISYVPLIIRFRLFVLLFGRRNCTHEGVDRRMGGRNRGRARLERNPSDPREDEQS
jgi:hypothetical protein